MVTCWDFLMLLSRIRIPIASLCAKAYSLNSLNLHEINIIVTFGSHFGLNLDISMRSHMPWWSARVCLKLPASVVRALASRSGQPWCWVRDLEVEAVRRHRVAISHPSSRPDAVPPPFPGPAPALCQQNPTTIGDLGPGALAYWHCD